MDGRIRQNLPKYPGVEARWPGRHTWRCTWQRAPPHILTTYICQLSQLQAPSQHRQHRQPGAGSPVSQSTNIVIYLSSSRQSPASGAAALGHSHTFTSPVWRNSAPDPANSSVIASNIFAQKYFLYRFCSKHKVPVLYYQHKFMTFPKRSHYTTPSSGNKATKPPDASYSVSCDNE